MEIPSTVPFLMDTDGDDDEEPSLLRFERESASNEIEGRATAGVVDTLKRSESGKSMLRVRSEGEEGKRES